MLTFAPDSAWIELCSGFPASTTSSLAKARAASAGDVGPRRTRGSVGSPPQSTGTGDRGPSSVDDDSPRRWFFPPNRAGASRCPLAGLEPGRANGSVQSFSCREAFGSVRTSGFRASGKPPSPPSFSHAVASLPYFAPSSLPRRPSGDHELVNDPLCVSETLDDVRARRVFWAKGSWSVSLTDRSGRRRRLPPGP